VRTDAYARTTPSSFPRSDFAYDFDSDGGMVGDGYMRQLQPVIAQMPYMGIPGSE